MAVSCSPEVLPHFAKALCSSSSGQSRAWDLPAFSQAEKPERPWDGVGTMRQKRVGHKCKEVMSER